MLTYQYFTKASLGLSFVFALSQPALSQISANGAGTLINLQGNQINISGGTQAGGNLFHSFQDFNVNSNQVANFLSNPQTQNILGRINGGNPSVINGLLQVTGGNSHLFLMNPAGIIFGQGASLNVPASFTATTANQIGFGNNVFNAFGDNNFSALTGNPDSFLFTTNQAGSIVNAGNLAVTSGQSISLLGGNVVNTGNLHGGNITLAAVPGTNRVRISQSGHLLSLEVTPSADSAISPLDLPRLLTGQSLPGISSNGEMVQVAGVTIPAGQGVNVTSGNLSLASSPLPLGEGSGVRAINILGDRVTLLNANLNAGGVDGGGTIRVGGEYRGGGTNPFNSRFTYVDANSFLRADAVNSGNGGRVIVWGDDTTRFYGNISARGGVNGGNGGFAEVSGAQTLTFAGNADLSAPIGSFGTLLLDPVNILISNGADALGGCALPNISLGCDPGDITISQATLEALGAATNIVLEASNDITFGTLIGGSLNFATCDTGICGDIAFTAGGAFSTSGNNINAFGRNLSITAGSITVDNINTSISTGFRDGGNINLIATTGNLGAGILNSGSSLAMGNSGNGGAVTINALNGSVIIGDVSSRSVVAGIGNSGNAGAISIESQDITTGILAAYSRVDEGVSGNGGNITLRANSGDVTSTFITTAAGAVLFGLGTSGNAGNITIDALNNINISEGAIPDRRTFNPTYDDPPFSLDSHSFSNGGIVGRAGEIRINQNISSQGNVQAISTITSQSIGVDNDSGNILINAGGDLNVFSLVSTSERNSGNITLNVGNSINIADLNSSSTIATGNINGDLNLTAGGDIFAGSLVSGGGDITLTAGNNIATSFLSSVGVYSGGDIGLQATSNIYSAFVQSNSTFGNGGNITLHALNGDIVVEQVSSEAQYGASGIGGNVNIHANGLFLAGLGFPFPIVARDGTLASITTQGEVGGGTITINHGGGATIPFLAGNAIENGTLFAITSGSGADTLYDLIVPAPPAVNNYGTNITIRTTAPIPLIPPIETPILPIETIDTSIFPLLTNPTPPSTPNPVIVGTPPILVVENIPVAPTINSPEDSASTGQITIAPPITNNSPVVLLPPPTVVVPPPSPTNPQLSRPILDANPPGTQSFISLTAANSSIPIIDRIPVDSSNNKIRLLDDPFKEEFQLFSGISDEIATLDVNQAQDILQRIMRETNTKPVFIYVFFAPENDAERNVNSARGLSSPLRVAQDTDILEVVLVPPTGDLVRVKYPGLKRPQVIEIAKKFVQSFVGPVSQTTNSYLASSRQFHEWLIAPLQEELKKREIDNLVFLMDVGLRSIPIAALRDQKNGDRFIIEDYSVGLMPSLTLTDTRYTPLKGSEVLGMGAATFVGANPLPGVPLELNTINQLWGGNSLINENFTLSNLRQARRPAQRIVHLATHGVFAPGEKSNSYIQLWGNERLTLDQIRQAGWGTPPVDLLVLSACQTALGDRESELGFAGLAVQAGVRSALAGLWQVSDVGTLGLMSEFYAQLQAVTTKSEALRQTQLAMLRGEVRLEGGSLITPQGTFPLNAELKKLGDRSLRHPYFWSGFTMVGNPW